MVDLSYLREIARQPQGGRVAPQDTAVRSFSFHVNDTAKINVMYVIQCQWLDFLCCLPDARDKEGRDLATGRTK